MSLTIHSQDLVKSYRNRTVVNHVSVNLEQGEIVGLLGPNGAGKTTTFYMVVGLIKPDSGSVFLDNVDITRMPMYKRAQMGIGYLPQEASVFRKLSVEDNIKAVLEMTKLTRAEQKDKLESLLDEFHLHHVRKNNGDSLSGGERRRTEIARALAVDPKFILLDEPFAGVDPIAVEDIQTVVARLKFRNIGILITDHNVNETLSICDRAYLLIDGKIFKHGTAEELAEDEQVRRLYLGRNFELRRKDYLHEEARKGMQEMAGVPGGTIHSEKMQQSLEYLIRDTDNLIRNAQKGDHPEEQDDLSDYTRFFTEIKESLIAYSNQQQQPKIAEAASGLRTLDVFDYYKTDHFGNILEFGEGSQHVRFRLDQFREDLTANKELLEKLLLYVKNPAFQEVM
ncbi:MAG TPA: LPS export ABC transporter ATP-binding protein [Puia sp.]|nr:LPS export ABC transporter ATP-binding protein [Puia sp.]